MASSRILDLANAINKNTSIIHTYLASQNIPFPSFSPGAKYTIPEELAAAQDAVLDATSELQDLLLPPMSALHLKGNVSRTVVPHCINYIVMRLE
jgi:hypothetical protein